MQKGMRPAACPFGSHRSIDPEGTLPHLAWKLDPSLPIHENELLIRMKTLNINAASFERLRLDADNDPAQLIQKIRSIVSMRGKMQNPITGSGGTLAGVVEEIGPRHPAYGVLQPGDEICTLVSLSLTPLVIEQVKSVDLHTGQLEVEGYGILFETGLYARVPEGIPTNVFLPVVAEAGSGYQANLLCRPDMTVMVVGAAEKVGLLSLFSLRQKLGNSGQLIAVTMRPEILPELESLEVADRILLAEGSDPLTACRQIQGELGDQAIDLIVDCSSTPGFEMFSILMSRERGTVYFANPAAHYSAAGLGAEGIGKELNLLFYRGYIEGHVDFCTELLRQYPALVRCFQSSAEGRIRGLYYCQNERSAHPDNIPANIVIHGPEMTEILRIAKRIAAFNTTVLITGETGTGKDVVANILHQFSDRRDKPFLKINCSAISENLFESELFGYEKGSFTGALRDGRAGYFEEANHGTLFLDEIGDMQLSSQVKLLRVLQSREVVRVGGSKAIPVDVRVILATNRNLRRLVERGLFREDLYYRINVVNFYVPPLRERQDSIFPLAQSFLQQYSEKFGVQKCFSPDAKTALLEYSWPGNIREMENIIQRLLLCSEKNVITDGALRREFQKNEGGGEPYLPPEPAPAGGEEDEETRYRAAAALCRSTREMAAMLRTSQSTVVRKLKKYGLHPSGA